MALFKCPLLSNVGFLLEDNLNWVLLVRIMGLQFWDGGGRMDVPRFCRWD